MEPNPWTQAAEDYERYAAEWMEKVFSGEERAYASEWLERWFDCQRFAESARVAEAEWSRVSSPSGVSCIS